MRWLRCENLKGLSMAQTNWPRKMDEHSWDPTDQICRYMFFFDLKHTYLILSDWWINREDILERYANKNNLWSMCVASMRLTNIWILRFDSPPNLQVFSIVNHILCRFSCCSDGLPQDLLEVPSRPTLGKPKLGDLPNWEHSWLEISPFLRWWLT